MYEELAEESGQRQINLNLIQRDASIPPQKGTLSKISFLWIYDIVKIGKERTLKESDLPPLDEKLCSSENSKKFSAALQSSRREYNLIPESKRGSFLTKLFYKVFKRQVILVAILVFGTAVASQLEPFLTVLVLKAYEEPRSLTNLSAGIAFFTVFVTFKVLVDVHLSFQNSIMELKMFGSISSSIMHKILKLASIQKEKYTLGDLQNYLQIDIKQANDFYKSLTSLVIFPLRLIVCIIIYYFLVGSRANVGVVVSFTQFILNLSLGKLYQSYQIQYMQAKDQRMNVLDEIFSGIKTIKLEGYHNYFLEKISLRRDEETYQGLKKNLFGIIFKVLSKGFYIINLILCVYFYDITSVADLMIITSNYGNLSSLLEGILTSIITFIVAHSSQSRLQSLLFEDILPCQDQRKKSLVPSRIYPNQSILIENASFKYPVNQGSQIEEQKNFYLSIERFSVNKGEIVAVIGPTGSGKTMLLLSLLSETEIEQHNNSNQSSFYLSSKNIALSTQTAWVMKGTFRENITFGQSSSFDHERYQQVLEQTQILQDIQSLPNKDQTQISEKGDSLSGGQKRRINLARTIYRGGDIFLLDDVLTGLDSQVSRSVMSKCLKGPLLENSTRVIFQSSLNYLNDVNRIFIINDGCIVREGTFQDIQSSPIYQQISTNSLQNFNDHDHDNDDDDRSNDLIDNFNQLDINIANNQDQLQNLSYSNQNSSPNKEDQNEGKVESWVYKKIFELFGGKCTAFFFVVLGLVSTYFQMAQFSVLKSDNSGESKQESSDNQNQSSKNQSQDEKATNEDFTSIMIKFIIFLIFGEVFEIMKTYIFCIKNYEFCRKFYNEISRSLLNGSYSQFYSQQPTGVLSNRLSNDIMQVDNRIFELINPILSIAFGCLGIFFIFITLKQLGVYVVNIIAIIVWYQITKIYLSVQRESTRIETVSKSSILNYFAEIYRGSQYIKQCVDPEIPIKEFQSYININIRNQIISTTVTNFYIFVILTVLIFFENSLFIVMFFDDSISGEKVAMVLVTAINMGLLVMSALLIWSIFESHAGIHIERCCQLAYQVPQEIGSPFLQEEHFNQASNIYQTEMGSLFLGSITARSATFGIKKNNLEIDHGEKIGIVGRTGAGKTSLTNGLANLLDLMQGEVLINKKSIKDADAKHLRQQFSFIPQEPFIFEGSLKENIDPQSKYTLVQLKDIYNELQLNDHSSFKSGLDSNIHQKGGNLSVGEKQLISIARCILKNSSIILIDEATSSLDEQTEKKITDLLSEKLKDKTILTIAHKLNTVLSSDRIFVINQGKLIEQGKPDQLLAQKNKSPFFKMLQKYIK